MDTGLIHIYCGDGKGKTTASLGLVLRCAGRGGKVLFAQFLKGRPTGELEALKALTQVTVLRGKAMTKFTFQMTADEKKRPAKPRQHCCKKSRTSAKSITPTWPSAMSSSAPVPWDSSRKNRSSIS